MSRSVAILCKSEQQAGLPDSRIANYNELDKVVVGWSSNSCHFIISYFEFIPLPFSSPLLIKIRAHNEHCLRR